MKYFISDTHFGHKNILKFERTEFTTIEEHDQYLIDSINSVVTNNDELYLLGDIGNMKKVPLLNGRKYLIVGNHDDRGRQTFPAFFAEVYDFPVYLTKRILLSHIPHPVDQGVLNVHGHLHGSALSSKNHLNLSAAVIKYKPVSMDTLEIIVGTLPRDVNKFLYEWYADLYNFKSDMERVDVVFDEEGNINLEESRVLHTKLKTDNSNYVLDVYGKES
jgi:calcineurin-like phosphoesterase family protein